MKKTELLSKDKFIEQSIRVNQAGEYGAKRIYAGQMKVLKNSDSFETIKHMYEQELEHLQYFNDEVSKRKIRPTAMMPIWHLGAFAMGAGTAILGEKAAMACTVAVEEVIDEHYAEQLEQLEDFADDEAGKSEDGEGDNSESSPFEADLRQKIAKFREEELEHRDIGLENKAEEAPAYFILKNAVKLATRCAIEISKRV